MRSYLVIPAGTPILRVVASAPHYAANKARRGKAEHIDVDGSLVLPASAAIERNDKRPVIPGQLTLAEAA